VAPGGRIKFVRAIPNTVPFTEVLENEPLFTAEHVGSTFERQLVNLGMIVTGHRK
jgi:hypothetical protein